MTLAETLIGWDHSLLHLINQGMTNSFFDWFFPFITDLHKTSAGKVIIPLLVFSLFYWKEKVKGLGIGFALCLCLGFCDFTGAKLKSFFERSRPMLLEGIETIQRSEAGHFSFPSNHAMNMFCLAVFMSFFIPKLRWPLFTMASLVAFSRVYNGVHFPSDVFAGALIGSVIGIFGALLTARVLKWQKS